MKRHDFTPEAYKGDIQLEGVSLNIKRINIIGMGDVGLTMVLGLMLYGNDLFEEIGILELDENARLRLEHELGQIRSLHTVFPAIKLIRKEELFRSDMVLFCASKPLPKPGDETGDVRLMQLEDNWSILEGYLHHLADHHFDGIIGIVSDPVDLLATRITRRFPFEPRKIMGFGQGVMAARAAFYGGEDVHLFGPHGNGLYVANHVKHFNLKESEDLTLKTTQENLVIRGFGYKPYIAPALSSAAIALVDLLRGKWHYSSQYVGNVHWGERYRFNGRKLELGAIKNHLLREQVTKTYEQLQAINDQYHPL